jgi:hypothetical protein
MLTVAIATEYDQYDGEVYRALLERLLGVEIGRWQTDMRFNGDRSVRKLAEPYLLAAARHGVRHALFAIDNDGGARRRPEHEDHHSIDPALDDDDCCRVCWLSASIPPSWQQEGRMLCVVVPVQALETWLLFLRGDLSEPTPEQCYDRGVLKRRFFGRPLPPVETRTALALAQVQQPGAIERLRQRRSFRLMEELLRTWQAPSGDAYRGNK